MLLIAYDTNALGRDIEACPRGLACPQIQTSVDSWWVSSELDVVAAAANKHHTNDCSAAALENKLCAFLPLIM